MNTMDQTEIEVAINQVRAARAARRALEDPAGMEGGGATVTFPVSVAAPGSTAGRNSHHWSWWASREPGSAFPPGTTPVDFRGRIGAVRFSGRFHVVVGDVSGPTPERRLEVGGLRGTGRPCWLGGLPDNVFAPALSPERLRTALGRRAAGEHRAVDDVLRSARPYLVFLADELTPQLHRRRHTVERDDVINEGWKRAYQLLGQFAGPDRPAVAWSTALFRNCRRDMRRAVHALDGVSEMVLNLRAAVLAHPGITEAEALADELAVEATERKLASEAPELSPAERRAAARREPGPCPYPIGQVRAAMNVPRIVSWDQPSGRSDGLDGGSGGRLADHLSGVDDPGLAAVEAPAAPAASALGELVGFSGAEVSDLLADLGEGGDGDACASRLPTLRRRVLRPFILPGEAPQSEVVLQRAGRRARAKLFVGDELLHGDALAGAWRAGVSVEEAARLDRRSA